MKKLVLLLSIITCILGLSGCAEQKQSDKQEQITQEVAAQYAESLIISMEEIISTDQQAQYASDEVIMKALESYANAAADLGDFQSIIDTEVKYTDDILINVTVQGSLRQAIIEIILEEETLTPTSIVTNVTYSFKEMMAKAALNTLMGMGTVFTVLIIIIFVISAFSLMNKPPKQEEKIETIPIIQEPGKTTKERQEEECQNLLNDQELVAVIAAAIAAYEGKSSADGYVVRSLRKRR